MSDPPPWGARLDPEALRRLAGHPEQLVGAELLRLEDGSQRGVRVVRLRTPDVEAEVVVDRALDLGRVLVRGVPVSWLSPTHLAAPWFAEPHGLGPFRTFFGGLLTTCGLEHTLGPTEDDASHFGYPGKATERFPLHGRISTSPARLLGYGLDERPEGLVLRVEGEVRQATTFGEAFLLRRRIELDVDGGTLRVEDIVRNVGYAPTPHMLLYHVNLGWPLVAPGAEVRAAVGAPRLATPAAEGVDWRRIDAPTRGAVEQVWEHTPRAGADGRVHAAVLNDDVGGGRPLGVEVSYDPATLPRLFQWRVMGEGHYVIGLEPGTLRIEGRQAAREAADLVVLEPGAERHYDLHLRLLSGAADIDAARSRTEGIHGPGT